MKNLLCTACMLSAVALAQGAEPVTLTIDAARKGAEIKPTMYGLFFEDINYGADGGLYAEMVKNRSFEFPQALTGWTTYGHVELKSDGPFERNPHYVTLNPAGHNDKHSGLENEGYFGVAFAKDAGYRFSVWARSEAGATLEVQLVDPAADGETVIAAQTAIRVDSREWKKYSAELKPEFSCADGRLRLFLAKPDAGSVDVEHISLFPTDTWRGHENGLRRDIAQALADVRPGVFRFPGGCIVEGTELPDRYQWKNTVGPVENRPTIQNRWQYTFKHRFAPDYYQSGGLGFYEYFLLAEEMGAEPLPVLNAGMICQYQNWTPDAHVPVDSLEPFIRDAVDLVEFANGPTTSKWGALRAEMGHPEPFGLKYIAIGNEQWGPEYVERLEPFVTALRKECPEIKIVGSAGPSPAGEQFDYLWPEMCRLGVDLVDEHYYCDQNWFAANADRYDNYPRKGTRVFAGEYACHPTGNKRNSFYAALHEAAFMTGLERNADVVDMATYAPLLAHKKGWQWRPDMIWFDNQDVTLTSSYQVQKLFSHNKGSHVLKATVDGSPLTGKDGLYATAAFDNADNSIIVKIANLSDSSRIVNLDIKGLKKASPGSVTATTLTADKASDNIDAYLVEQTGPTGTTPGTQSIEIPAEAFAVYRFAITPR
ncbi:MAG: carbohydrate binding domain-containing protein [Muribaculaceae bacterium]|nr:carbohydrate binding domain-containing protein [Muribaculaceae bacterium]